MPLGSYETVIFPTIGSGISVNFQKVISDSQFGVKPIIDWKDNLKTNEYIE